MIRLLLVFVLTSSLTLPAFAQVRVGETEVISDNNRIGISEAEYRQRLEDETADLTAQIEDLRSQRARLEARADVDLTTIINLKEQITAKQRALDGARVRLSDIESAYAALQTTVANLNDEFAALRALGRMSTDLLHQAQAALNDGDFALAKRKVDGLIDDLIFEDNHNEVKE